MTFNLQPYIEATCIGERFHCTFILWNKSKSLHTQCLEISGPHAGLICGQSTFLKKYGRTYIVCPLGGSLVLGLQYINNPSAFLALISYSLLQPPLPAHVQGYFIIVHDTWLKGSLICYYIMHIYTTARVLVHMTTRYLCTQATTERLHYLVFYLFLDATVWDVSAIIPIGCLVY